MHTKESWFLFLASRCVFIYLFNLTKDPKVTTFHTAIGQCLTQKEPVKYTNKLLKRQPILNYKKNYKVQYCVLHVGDQGPDLQNILRQSYNYLTIMPKLRSTYDGRLIYEWNGKLFIGKIHVQNRNIVGDSVVN